MTPTWQPDERDTCLNCPLPECATTEYYLCPLAHLRAGPVIAEMTRKWNAEVTRALRGLQREVKRAA